ncbi:DGQHR domain-containing protein [Candidatus Methylospira mobilis]|uniref:DGQHR domain-containing protein n=1 Tax=Candidatus Methylospira mobilis TaxID=1808979 RepID=UPI0028EE0A65|nr:DGQHR domain-containing protein [Candidatus Methylospira mobilis]WNV05876.1 DGQHR domain-containing protein [Candidatus Methylospira mobilis]WNV05963.1 DGQHR domain-containing protein [Candidatus Methylospira mobilis]
MTQITPQKFPFIQVEQPIGTFFVCAIPAAKILPLLAIERRGLTPEERLKVQRALDTSRQKDIAEYACEPDATFPTSVTLSANSEYVHVIEHTSEIVIGIELENDSKPTASLTIIDGDFSRQFVGIPDGQTIAVVIDGQHRIEGLKLAGAGNESSRLAGFNIPFVFMFDLSPEDMAKIFVTINSTQRKVDKSLISDLFGLSSRRSPQRTCHLIAVALNSTPEGPFYNGLKMLGRRVHDTEFLSQGSFCKYLLKLFSRKPEDDERKLYSGQQLSEDERAPLRKYFVDEKDEMILRIVSNYFTAVSNVYSKAWTDEPAKYLLRKTVGFSALIQLLIKIAPVALQVKDASIDAFMRVFKKIHDNLPDSELAVGKFSSSEAEATKMCNLMYSEVEMQISALLKSETDLGAIGE